MSKSLIYLSSPYSKYPFGREEAYREVCKKAMQLMDQGFIVFCPIAHSHSIEVESGLDIRDGVFWLRQDLAVLGYCDELWVYKMPGWEASVGVAAEIAFAEVHGIPIEYVEFEEEYVEE